jgi:hypothetical protein
VSPTVATVLIGIIAAGCGLGAKSGDPGPVPVVEKSDAGCYALQFLDSRRPHALGRQFPDTVTLTPSRKETGGFWYVGALPEDSWPPDFATEKAQHLSYIGIWDRSGDTLWAAIGHTLVSSTIKLTGSSSLRGTWLEQWDAGPTDRGQLRAQRFSCPNR